MSTPASPELRRGLCLACVKAIQKETSGHFENALLAVVQATCFPPRYFAHVFTPCTHLGVLDCHWGLNTFQQNKRHAGFGFKSHCE
jgi:hypothetical protein